MHEARSYHVRPDQPFDLNVTLSSGQAFRWIYDGFWWKGYIATNVVFIRQDSNSLFYHGVPEEEIVRYFSLDTDLFEIYDIISADRFMKQAIKSAQGLRLIRQDPWSCIACHICTNRSQRTSAIDRITRIADILGSPVTFNNEIFSIFPTPSDILHANSYQIRDCNLGHSNHLHLVALAELFVNNPDWLHHLYQIPYSHLIQALHRIGGVSKSAAEYIAFSAFDALEAFPVDSHIRDLFSLLYLKDRNIRFSDQQALDHIIQQEAREKFGRYAAYAFEYLFVTRDVVKELI